jgi:predicted negative regulator of RcsB-dependent stress response
VEQYQTEEEQVEALRRWWNENGKSIIAAVIIALSGGMAWQTWQGQVTGKQVAASDAYQSMMQSVSGEEMSDEQQAEFVELAEILKDQFSDSTYAQFAALHQARLAVEADDLDDAEQQLRWVLAQAGSGGDISRVAQLRLARVLAASGDVDQALAILEHADAGPYKGSYAMARGDILLANGREDEARNAYNTARMEASRYPGQLNLVLLDEKIQSLNPIPATPLEKIDDEGEQ